jgi:hypothetical protein
VFEELVGEGADRRPLREVPLGIKPVETILGNVFICFPPDPEGPLDLMPRTVGVRWGVNDDLPLATR